MCSMSLSEKRQAHDFRRDERLSSNAAIVWRLLSGTLWSGCSRICSSMVMVSLCSMHAGMQAFGAALADEGLLGLCDTILEALHFCAGFQTCLTCGESFQSLDMPVESASRYATSCACDACGILSGHDHGRRHQKRGSLYPSVSSCRQARTLNDLCQACACKQLYLHYVSPRSQTQKLLPQIPVYQASERCSTSAL